MKSKRLHEEADEITYVLVLDTGEEVTGALLDFAKKQQIRTASFTAIGALRELTLGYFDWQKKEYEKIHVAEQVELLSLAGNIVSSKDGPKLHAHIVVGKRDGTAHGGHLVDAIVRPTLEMMIVESTAARLERQQDEASGLPLIKF
ncbi:MAG TPA: PPC domain-containing DNA-binding protein [Pirellulales bacterium]|nr:PPC domain-containing DNA-binding protein [Pirellulales bacterium]